MPRHAGIAPYYKGNSRISTGYMTPEEWANEMRYIASLMPDDAPEAVMRRVALRSRAEEINAGRVNTIKHFHVIVPYWKTSPKGNKVLRAISYPCNGCQLYSFDEAWIMMEIFAAKRGWSDGHEMEAYAEGSNQNLSLGILYDGIAEPMKDVPEGVATYNV